MTKLMLKVGLSKYSIILCGDVLSVVQDDMVGSEGVPPKPPVSPGTPDQVDDHPSPFIPVMAAGDRVCLKIEV